MIKLIRLIKEQINERMSFSDFMNTPASKDGRIDRSKDVSVKPLIVTTKNDKEAWKFSYKTGGGESTTGRRHQGFIYFLKGSVDPNDDALKLDCSVDCSCPDYKYRLSYNNNRMGSGEIGPNSLNKNNGMKPLINIGPGLCKHLIKLKEYLNTKIENKPKEEPVEPEVDKNEAPQEPIEPSVLDKSSEEIPKTEPSIEEPEIKENIFNKSRIIEVLDNLCKIRTFVIK